MREINSRVRSGELDRNPAPRLLGASTESEECAAPSGEDQVCCTEQRGWKDTNYVTGVYTALRRRGHHGPAGHTAGGLFTQSLRRALKSLLVKRNTCALKNLKSEVHLDVRK